MRGQKPSATTSLRLSRKLKQKKFQKDDFLILFLAPSQNFLAENFTLPQGEGDDAVSLTSFFVSIGLQALIPLSAFRGYTPKILGTIGNPSGCNSV